MGSDATPPASNSDSDDNSPRFGDRLSGRLPDIDIGSVEAVRDERERS